MENLNVKRETDTNVLPYDTVQAMNAAADAAHVPGPSDAPTQESVCARCGYRPGAQLAPSEEDMQEYMRSLLGTKPFKKEYSIYEGELKLTFRTLKAREVDSLNNILFEMMANIANLRVQDLSIKLKLLYFLSCIQTGPESTELTIPEITQVSEIQDAFQSVFGDYSEPLIRIMSQTLTAFLELQEALVDTGFDENFWKGAGLG